MTRTGARRLRLAVAGCGRVFERCHAPALERSLEWEVSSVCDPSPECRQRALALFPGASVHASLDRLLEGSDADALLVAAPPEVHAPLALLGLRRGLHALVEKPLAPTAQEALLLVEAAGEEGRHLAVGFQRRFRAPYAALREKARGAPPDSARGARFELVTDAGRWAPGIQEDPRRTVLLDVAVHQLDLVPWLLGRSLERVRVSPLESPSPLETLLEIEMDLGGGVRGTCIAGSGPRYRERLEIELEGRRLVAAGGSSGGPGDAARSLFRRALGRPSLTVESFIAEHDAFAEAVRGGRFRGAAGLSGLEAALAVEASLASLAAGGGWVAVPRALSEPTGKCP